MRPPDLIIGPRDNPQTLRWHLIKFRGWQFALHKWMRSDDDRALHDHSGHNISILLTGRYRELVRLSPAKRPMWAGTYIDTWHTRYPLVPYFRRADQPHRVALIERWVNHGGRHAPMPARPVWTLWLRWPPIREWGFHCPKGWRHWKEYCDMRDGKGSEIGKGCD